MRDGIGMGIWVGYATLPDAEAIAELAVQLTDEISTRTRTKLFDVSRPETARLCRRYIESGLYSVIVARKEQAGEIIGFASLCESSALYAMGHFGIIQEFYVRPEHRSSGVGKKILAQAAELAKTRGWKRLELCTPPLPEFDKTVDFYGGNGFEVTGGRKMKLLLG